MAAFHLNLFPPGSLAGSVTTAVWIGVFVSAFFNLRFGWSLSGLVVPGYLVPLILLKPVSAGVIVLESVCTYGLVVLLFRYLPAMGAWSSVFGRDRFFAILLISVGVRLVLDGYLLPAFGGWINAHYALNFDYRNHLHSFGLIITALIANQFWKPGLVRGLFPFVVTVGITYLIIRYGLMEYTNFSISTLGYMYEEMAASMLASPKAYIILLSTAFLASHMNLHYGWEYSGILIPSLLALLWYQPLKIAATLMETVVILAAAGWLLKLPLFQKTTIEGGRKILLFFNVSYAYKFLLSYAVLWLAPRHNITDYYGFGYLLPSLMAIKMHDKEIFARVTRATVQTSLLAMVAASVIGFSLTLVRQPQIGIAAPETGGASAAGVARVGDLRLIDQVKRDKMGMYRKRIEDLAAKPSPGEMHTFANALRLIQKPGAGEGEVTAAAGLLSRIGYGVKRVAGRYAYLFDTRPERGWGTYVIDTRAGIPSPLLVTVPVPLDERGALEAGTWLFTVMNGSALAIAGPAFRGRRNDATDAFNRYDTLFQTFTREMRGMDLLQVRGFSAIPKREAPDTETTLWVNRELPAGLHLGRLREYIGNFAVEWGAPPGRIPLRADAGTASAEIFLSREAIRRLLFKPLLGQYEVPFEVHQQRIDGYLQDWLMSDKSTIADKGTGLFVPPLLEEMLFFDGEVLTPLLRLMAAEYRNGGWSPAGEAELRGIAASAAVLGYEIIRYHHSMSGRDYLILMEGQRRRFWGTYVFRLGAASEFLVQIPRPVFELNVFEFGVTLFERINARALLIGGAHKDANLDGSADLIRLQNRQNLFNLVHQVLLRESGPLPMLTLQIRAIGVNPDQPPPSVDIVISEYPLFRSGQPVAGLRKGLLDSLKSDEISYRFVDGSRETAGYEVGGVPQSLYMDQTRDKSFMILWLSRLIRIRHRQQTDNYWQQAAFDAAGIPTRTGYLQPYLREDVQWGNADEIGESVRGNLRHYIRHHDIVALRTMVRRSRGLRFERFVDLNTRQVFLMTFSKRGALLLLANLSPKIAESDVRLGDARCGGDCIGYFLNTRSAWLTDGGG